MLKNLLHGGRLVDEGDDAHLGVADRAEQRERLIDTRQKHRPQIARHRAMAGLLVVRRGSRCWRDGSRSQRRHRRAQRCIGRQHAVVAMAMRTWPWYQSGDPVDQLQRRQHQITGAVGAWLGTVIDQMLGIALV